MPGSTQCDQILRNFTALANFQKSLAILSSLKNILQY